MTKNKINNKANDFGYIDRLLSIWYNKSNDKVFQHYFNKVATTIITTYLQQTKNSKIVNNIMKANFTFDDYKALENDIRETFENDFLLYDVFEHIIY